MDSPLRRGGRPRKTVDTQKVAQLRQQGLSFRKIAKTLRLGEGTVRRAVLHQSNDICLTHKDQFMRLARVIRLRISRRENSILRNEPNVR